LTLKIDYKGLYRAQRRANKVSKRQKPKFLDESSLNKKIKKSRIKYEEKDDGSTAKEFETIQ